MPRWWRRYLERHQHPASRALHAVGVPMIPLALILAGVQLAQGRWDVWWRPVGLLVLSYFLQWVGHRIEGNDLGEVVFFKKLLGRPYTAVSPRFARCGESRTLDLTGESPGGSRPRAEDRQP